LITLDSISSQINEHQDKPGMQTSAEKISNLSSFDKNTVELGYNVIKGT
jgi:hypothetical protein